MCFIIRRYHLISPKYFKNKRISNIKILWFEKTVNPVLLLGVWKRKK